MWNVYGTSVNCIVLQLSCQNALCTAYSSIMWLLSDTLHVCINLSVIPFGQGLSCFMENENLCNNAASCSDQQRCDKHWWKHGEGPSLCSPYLVLQWLCAIQLCLLHWDKSWYPQEDLLLKLKPLCRPSEEHEGANSPHWSSGGKHEDGLVKSGHAHVQQQTYIYGKIQPLPTDHTHNAGRHGQTGDEVHIGRKLLHSP